MGWLAGPRFIDQVNECTHLFFSLEQWPQWLDSFASCFLGRVHSDHEGHSWHEFEVCNRSAWWRRGRYHVPHTDPKSWHRRNFRNCKQAAFLADPLIEWGRCERRTEGGEQPGGEGMLRTCLPSDRDQSTCLCGLTRKCHRSPVSQGKWRGQAWVFTKLRVFDVKSLFCRDGLPPFLEGNYWNVTSFMKYWE